MKNQRQTQQTSDQPAKATLNASRLHHWRVQTSFPPEMRLWLATVIRMQRRGELPAGLRVISIAGLERRGQQAP